MYFQILARKLLPFVAVLALAGCHHEEAANAPGGNTPEAAVQQSITLIKDGDFGGFFKQALPPVDYANLRTDWVRSQPNKPITDEERAHFTQAVQQLTAPNAQVTLYAQLQPKLMQMEQQYGDQMPVLITIGQAWISNHIVQNADLGAAQKQQANDALNALLPWARQADWFDQNKAKQAVGVVVDTARQLNLKSPDQLTQMDFDSAMSKYSQLFSGMKQLLSVYGLSVDATLNSAKVTTIGVDHGSAHVKVAYLLQGKPLSIDFTLTSIDGRWYSQDLVNTLRKAHEQWLHPAIAGTAPSPASSVPPRAADARGK